MDYSSSQMPKRIYKLVNELEFTKKEIKLMGYEKVIHCKDCINATEDKQDGVYECTYFWDTNLVLENDYCSRAERKDDVNV